jgi:Uma2 family endonuclease
MSETTSTPQAQSSGSLLVSGVDWKTYSRFLRTFAERPGYRLTYDRGTLEIIGPSTALRCGRLLATLVFVLTDELHLALKRGGSTTLRRRLKKRGVEADECFWIANAHRMGGGKGRLDLRTDPPPDLAIEVDVSHSSLDRLAIYAALGVPEVWRLEGDLLTFHVLDQGAYQSAATSRAFPMLAPADLLPFIQQARQAADENPVVRQFRAWIRQRQAIATPPGTP